MSVQTSRRILKLNSQGEDVKYLQTFLNDYRYGSLAEDGIFGPKTETVVKKFQATNNLLIDGIVGSKTWAAIIEEQSAPPC